MRRDQDFNFYAEPSQQSKSSRPIRNLDIIDSMMKLQ